MGFRDGQAADGQGGGSGGEGTTGMGMVGARQHCDLMDRQVKPTAD